MRMDISSAKAEVIRLESDLAARIALIQQDASRRILAEIKAMQPALSPLVAFLAATQGSPAVEGARRHRANSAESTMLRALLESADGIRRKELDQLVIDGGLSVSAARKARYNIEKEGLAVKVGQVWSLTQPGRDEALAR